MLFLQLARDARYYHATTLEEEGRADVVILASRLAGVGYDVTIRTALGEPALQKLLSLFVFASLFLPFCFFMSW